MSIYMLKLISNMLETAVGGAEDGISSGDTILEMNFLSPYSSIILFKNPLQNTFS